MEREILDRVCLRMMEFEAGNPDRIQHFVKVHALAALIGRAEGLDPKTQFTLEAAAYVHDIGIAASLKHYGSADGKYQEELGEIPSREILRECGVDSATYWRVSYLVAHHHTYNAIEDADHRILVEADFLVNLQEGDQSPEVIRQTYDKIFRTKTGRAICAAMFGL